MNVSLALFSFLFFTALVGVLTWFFARGKEISSNEGFFLAGRSLTFPFIAASLLLTNLSTEQLVGLNGDGFTAGLSVMVWEVVAVITLVLMALFFLPRFLKSGITTVPDFLEIRFGRSARIVCSVIFLLAYMLQLLPIILYTGAVGLTGILDLTKLTGIEDESTLLWMSVWIVGVIGMIYALFGGLRSIVISDLLNGIGLLTGGLMITWFGLRACGMANGGEGILAGLTALKENVPEHLNSIGGPRDPVPFWQIFTGVFLINAFYWCTNQQIIQRTLGASSLKEGQKGVLLTGFLKLIGPLYLVLPGIMAYYLYSTGNLDVGGDGTLRSVDAYGTLVRNVLPECLTGFFAAVMVGAVLSSFNSALNSTCTLFSLNIYKGLIKPDASDNETVRVGKYFGFLIAVGAMLVAPQLAATKSIFTYLQEVNGIYFIPIFAVVLIGLLHKRVPQAAANVGLVGGVIFISVFYLIKAFAKDGALDIVSRIGTYHFLGAAFVIIVLAMFAVTAVWPLKEAWQHKYSGDVDITPWKGTVPVSLFLIIFVIVIYGIFADFSVLSE